MRDLSRARDARARLTTRERADQTMMGRLESTCSRMIHLGCSSREPFARLQRGANLRAHHNSSLSSLSLTLAPGLLSAQERKFCPRF